MNRRIRILHGVSHFALGGAERVALTISRALRADFDFSIFAVRGKIDDGVGQNMMDELRTMNIPTLSGPRIPMRFGGILTGAWSLARAVQKFQPDIIHLHTEVPESSYAALTAIARKHRGRPVLRTIHNTNFWRFHWRLGQWCDRKLNEATCVGVSQGAQTEMLRLRADSGGDPFRNPPAIVLNGVTPPERLKESWRLGKTIRVLFGGRLEQEKGADLIPAIIRKTVLPAGHTARLDVFGDGALREDLENRFNDNFPGWTVKCHRPVPDFREKMADYDILIMPSRFEGLPLTAAEAAMSGLPIVATNAPGSIEALPKNHPWMAEAGDAESFADCLSNAFTSVGEWPQIARTTREFATESFSVGKMAQNYAEIYRNLAATPQTTHASDECIGNKPPAR